mmetsp:Transcript_110444/g.191385  ORF Transcript_110444/g.191385 Transcript_110444/m.191385 type:complete len:95 (-) Transcript_110444:79-363(-)
MGAEGEEVNCGMNNCLLEILVIRRTNQCEGWQQETLDVIWHCGSWVRWVCCPFEMECLKSQSCRPSPSLTAQIPYLSGHPRASTLQWGQHKGAH